MSVTRVETPPVEPVERTKSFPATLHATPDTLADSSGGGRARPTTLRIQDLSADMLIHSAPRTLFQDAHVPTLGGIPLLSKLGQGGMGAVYYGFHPRLNQEVAVKVLPFEMAVKNPTAIDRFFREAQLAASVKSPHLVGVLDVNQEGGLFYIVMEFVKGSTAHAHLREVLKSGAPGLRETAALDLCIAACSGLAAAHARGIIHRDVKPDNILIPHHGATLELNMKGAQLADLGLARHETLDDSAVTRADACMGTPGYMSPEQVRDAKTCGKPSDVFSMGVTLYAFLSGRSPFAASALLDILKSTTDAPHPPIRTLRPEISAETALVLDRCLEKDPAERYADAGALLAALKACRAGLATLRILISNPGDVAEERDMARLVVGQLQRHYGSRIRLRAVLWDELALQPDTPIQDGIDLVSSPEYGIDIAVFIVWSRLGSALGRADRKPDGPPFRSTTERELFFMLEARSRQGGSRPQILAYARNDSDGFEARLETAESAELSVAVEERRLASAFVRERFRDESGRGIRACHAYDKPLTFAGRFKVHLRAAIDEILGDGAVEGTHWTHDPYRGLQVFDLEHAPIFFGREREVCELQELLRRRAPEPRTSVSGQNCAFVAIVGASGSGKSSLARAGVAAALVRDNLDSAVKQWRLAILQPSAVEGGPFAALVNAIAKVGALPELLDGGTSKDDIATGLSAALEHTVKLSLKPAFARAAQTAGGDVKLFLVLDQTEELWTDRNLTDDGRERFLTAIEALAKSGSVWVLATLRTDFYPLAQRSETFLRLKGNDGHYDLVAPGPGSLQRIITQPARLAGLHFERNESAGHSLDNVILRDAIHQPDALPLLEYALDQLFRGAGVPPARAETEVENSGRAGGTPTPLLTFDAYKKMGGVEGALGQKAESEFITLPPAVQSVFGSVMNALVTVDVDAEGQALRRSAPYAGITDTAARKALVDALIQQRLLTADNEGGTPVVRVAHEALLRRWERLVQWTAANRDCLRLRARVEHAQARWQQAHRDKSLLLPMGLPLEEGHKLLREGADLLTEDTKAYIRESVRNHEAAAKRSLSARRIVTSALAALLVLALAGGVFAWVKQGDALNALKEQKRLSFEAILRNAEADDAQGESAKVIAALEPYLLEHSFAQHPMRAQAETLVEKARDGYKRLAAFAAQIRKSEPAATLDLGQGVMLEMILIPPGKFTMGSPENEPGREVGETLHEVTITKPFYMGKFHVTQEQYQMVMGTNPSYFTGKPKNPIEEVTWFDAVAFCEKLEKQSGTARVHFSLPTDAQYEYACRAGTQTRFYFGDDENELGKYAWYKANATIGEPDFGKLPVGSKNRPNKFGLQDMHGTVFVWCRDWYDSKYYTASPKTDPEGPEKGAVQESINGAARIVRGGSWHYEAQYARSACRSSFAPNGRISDIGIRLVAYP